MAQMLPMGRQVSPQGNEHWSQMAQHSEGRLMGRALARAVWTIAAVIAIAATTPAWAYSSRFRCAPGLLPEDDPHAAARNQMASEQVL